MSGITPNLGLEYLDASQEQPEVKINDAWNKIDALALDISGLTVEDDSASPPTVFTGTKTLKVTGGGATLSGETDGVVIMEITSGGGGSAPSVIQLSCSDLVTPIGTATNVAYVRSPSAFTLSAVRASLLVASSSGSVSVDIKKNGTTILSTALSIDATELTSTTAATPAVISTSAIGDDDAITIDITGAGTGAQGLIVTLIGS